MKFALHILTGWLMIISLTLSSCQDNQSNKPIASAGDSALVNPRAEKDSQIIAAIAANNYAEIEMAKTAIEKSENKEVKELAGELQADHSLFVNQLKSYAASHQLSIPNMEPDKAVEDTRELAAKTRPDEFDKKWCAEMLDKHEQTIAHLEDAARDATDPDLKAWINNTLPKVRKQRDKLKDCNDSLR